MTTLHSAPTPERPVRVIHCRGATNIWSAHEAGGHHDGQPAVVAIGNFDGVHRGHQSLITRAKREAEDRGISCAVVTFDPHPRQVIHPSAAFGVVSAPHERISWLHDAGADVVLVWPFDEVVQAYSPATFLTEIGRYVQPRVIVHGRGFALGHGRIGTPEHLAKLGETFGWTTVEVTPQVADPAATQAISSSGIRAAMELGAIDDVAHALGRWPTYLGTVVHGNKVGRTIGFPTANLEAPIRRVVPADGIYAAWAERYPCTDRASVVPAALSIGYRPTFQGTIRLVEAFLLDFDDDLYGEELRVHIVGRIRGQERFDTVEALISRMNADVLTCREVLAQRPMVAKPASA